MTQSTHPSVAVLGAGSWGTALAALIARHGHATTLWGRDPAVAAAIEGQVHQVRRQQILQMLFGQLQE